MSSSSSRSASPEPALSSPKKSKKSGEKKKKSKHVQIADPDGRNEAPDQNAYQPPEGAVLMQHKVEESDFDWDALDKDENLELWLVRVPDGVKPKHLQNIKLDVPSSSRSARVGFIERKTSTLDIWALGEDAGGVGGEEMAGLSCLLPRKKHSGKLYQAPKPIARRLVVTARTTLPTPEASPVVAQNPPRYHHPKELLKHRFMPLGALAQVEGDAMEVDTPPSPSKPTKPRSKHKADEAAPKSQESAPSGKKRKEAEDTPAPPKKAKKVKTTS